MSTNSDQPQMAWSDAVLGSGVTVIKAVHLNHARSALTAVYLAVGRPAPTFPSGAVGAGAVIAAAHISELRTAVLAVW